MQWNPPVENLREKKELIKETFSLRTNVLADFEPNLLSSNFTLFVCNVFLLRQLWSILFSSISHNLNAIEYRKL